MKRYFEHIDRFAVTLTQAVIRYRYLVVLVSFLAAIGIGSGASKLAFSTDYRIFFSDANPELTAFESLQNTYTKNDNITIMIVPKQGDVFQKSVLEAVEWTTEQAWQIPFTQRVDSISNFQHTYAQEDDLIVEDLFSSEDSPRLADEIRRIALNEPLLIDQLVSGDARATIVNVTLNYPNLDVSEVPEATAKVREIREELLTNFENIDVYLSGVSMLNNAFSEASLADMGTLVPTMFAVILLLTLLISRSLTGTLATLFVIALSSMVAMGIAGFAGVKLTPIAGQAPTIILTLAIADSIHILMTLRGQMRAGMDKHSALIEAIRVNFLPVAITSLTTIIGFLALNFSDSPPFWHLGNMTAVGILAAFLLSVTLLPAVVAILPFKVKQKAQNNRIVDGFANWVIQQHKVLAISLTLISVGLITLIPRIEFNDQWTEYFSKNIEFRQETDKVTEKFGIYPVEFSLPAKAPGLINDPEYLQHLAAFAAYLTEQDVVEHVYAFSDILKRLNKNLNEDQDSFYRTPDSQELAAQYLLLYEMSLPYGLDLNDRVNIDKSATRVTATLGNTSTKETRAFLENTKTWINQNLPPYMQQTLPTSAQVMFTYIAQRNVTNMIAGTSIAIIAISVVLMLSLMSFRLGLLSLVPNGLPILTTFGAWAILIGEVGFSVAAVASISLGIIVDDTVHFLSKYNRARTEKGLNAADSIRFSFNNVGIPILVNTIILAIGFIVLTTSSFKVNFDMGMLTAIAIVFALILDFLLLPALLLIFDKKDLKPSH